MMAVRTAEKLLKVLLFITIFFRVVFAQSSSLFVSD